MPEIVKKCYHDDKIAYVVKFGLLYRSHPHPSIGKGKNHTSVTSAMEYLRGLGPIRSANFVPQRFYIGSNYNEESAWETSNN